MQTLDLTGQACPLPLLKTKQALISLQKGEILQVITSDPGSLRDIPLYLQRCQHQLLKQWQQDTCYYFQISVEA